MLSLVLLNKMTILATPPPSPGSEHGAGGLQQCWFVLLSWVRNILELDGRPLGHFPMFQCSVNAAVNLINAVTKNRPLWEDQGIFWVGKGLQDPLFQAFSQHVMLAPVQVKMCSGIPSWEAPQSPGKGKAGAWLKGVNSLTVHLILQLNPDCWVS